MSKFTPGPWSHRNGRIFQTDYEVLTIANVARAGDGDYSPANGSLLADAPALLKALATMTELASLKWGNLDAGVFSEIEKARSLIAKHGGGV